MEKHLFSKKALLKIRQLFSQLNELGGRIEDLQQSVGRVEMRQLESLASMNIRDNEFKVSSQNGEDGIIQFLIRNIHIENKIFVEFGVHNYKESNTRFLLQNDNWAGLVIDGSQDNIDSIKSDSIYWRHNLKAECAFIDKDNIDWLIRNNGVYGNIGILSVDIDGNDYWIWQAIECISPSIVVCEYNSLFGAKSKVTIPYDKEFSDKQSHYSRLYWGASVGAFHNLAQQKGYSLVGSNAMGNNIFFVKNDLVGDVPSLTPEQAYIESNFRISRDIQGNLSFLDRKSCLELIANLPLHQVDTGETIMVADI